MKFNRTKGLVGVLSISALEPTAYALQYQYYRKYLKYHDYKATSNSQATKVRAKQALSSFKPYRNEYYIELKVSDNSSSDPFTIRIYNGSGYSDNDNTDNLATWVLKHINVGDVIRGKFIGTLSHKNKRILCTKIKKIKPVKITNQVSLARE